MLVYKNRITANILLHLFYSVYMDRVNSRTALVYLCFVTFYGLSQTFIFLIQYFTLYKVIFSWNSDNVCFGRPGLLLPREFQLRDCQCSCSSMFVRSMTTFVDSKLNMESMIICRSFVIARLLMKKWFEKV